MTQQYKQALSQLDTVDKTRGWFHPHNMPHDIRHVSLAGPPLSPPPDFRQPGSIPATPQTSRPARPLPSDIKHWAAAGPLSNDMRYPQIHSVPHGGATRASFRGMRHGSISTADRDLYRAPAAAGNAPAAGSLRRKSNDIGRPRETTFGTPRAGLPPGDYIRKHELLPPGDWTAASELEYRV